MNATQIEVLSLPPDAVMLAGNRPTTTSMKVAAAFDKDHSHVLRDIRGFENLGDFYGSNYGLVSYVDKKGEKRPVVEMTRDGFMLLAMGFKGEKALRLKVAFLERFKSMERELTCRTMGPITQEELNSMLKRPVLIPASEYLQLTAGKKPGNKRPRKRKSGPKKLTSGEKKVIVEMSEEKYSQTEIAKALGRSRSTIQRYLYTLTWKGEAKRRTRR